MPRWDFPVVHLFGNYLCSPKSSKVTGLDRWVLWFMLGIFLTQDFY